MSDHPVRIVQTSPRPNGRPPEVHLVPAADAPAAEALEFGFRPGVASVPVGPPINDEGGGRPETARQPLKVPDDPSVVLPALRPGGRPRSRPTSIWSWAPSLRSPAPDRRRRRGDHPPARREGPVSVVWRTTTRPATFPVTDKAPKPRSADAQSGQAERRRGMATLATAGRPVFLIEAIRKAYFIRARRSRSRRPAFTIIVLGDGSYDILHPER